MSTNQRDKIFLRELSTRVSHELMERKFSGPFRLKRKLRLRKTYTDGWLVTLGTLPEYKCRAEIWLDRFTSHEKRKVYYCIYSRKPHGVAKLATLAQPELGKHLSVYLKDWSDDADIPCLTNRLAKARFGHPIYERYAKNREFLYGIYEFDKTGLQKNVLVRLSERAADFFTVFFDALSQKSRADKETFPRVENRQKVMRHVRRERSCYAATLCKQRDNYVCQICKFDFSKTYGKLGEDFAEAHHIIPLSSNKKLRNTTPDDLITVCANCHRILHRMDGTSRDIRTLKRIVKR